MATNDGGVAAALASAKKTLSDVSHSNVDTGGQHSWTKPSYSAARAARMPESPKRETGLAGEAHDAGVGIANRMKQQAAVTKELSGQ